MQSKVSESQKNQVRQLLQSPQWDCLEQVIKMKIEQWKEESTLKDTEWETIKATCFKEGRIRGLNEFMQELYNLII